MEQVEAVRRRQQGSVLLYVMVLLTIISTLVGAVLLLSGSAYEMEVRRQDEVRAQATFLSGVMFIETRIKNGTEPIGSYTFSLGEATCNLLVTDYSAVMPKALYLDMTVTIKGKEFRRGEIIGSRSVPKTSDYALVSNTAFTTSRRVVLGAFGENGDMAGNATIALTGAGTVINGVLEAVSSINKGTGTVTGKITPFTTRITFPTITPAIYQAAATQSFGSTTISNLTFSGVEPLLCVNGNLDLSGTISGAGTVFVNGNLTVSGNLRYATSQSRVAFVVNGGVEFGPNVTQGVGYFFTNQTFRTSSGVELTISRGAVAAQAFEIRNNFNLTYDPSVWEDPNEGRRLRLPGYWP